VPFIIPALFFGSGLTALAYQVIWFKRLSHVWGSSSLATASVVGAFLLGLGVGAHFIGRYADRAARPLLIYGVLEVIIALLAAAIPWELEGLYGLSGPLTALSMKSPAAAYIVRLLITFIVIGIPTTLMGGTLPLLVRQRAAVVAAVAPPAAWLYAINTLGAAAGCYLAGFHLIPALGLWWSNWLAVGANLAIGIIAIGLGAVAVIDRARRRPEMEIDAARAAPGAWVIKPHALYLAVFLTGLGALMLEMIWARQLALILGGSTYAFTAMLFVVLLGIALGSLLYRVWARRVVPHPFMPAIVIIALVVMTAAGTALIPQLSLISGLIRPMRDTPSGNAVFCALTSGVLEFIPALAMGVLFPMFIHMRRTGTDAAGSTVGTVYAFNTLGTVLGASLTYLLLLPNLGLEATLALALGLYLIAMCATIPFNTAARWYGGIVCVGIGVLAVRSTLHAHDRRITDSGRFFYGYLPPEQLIDEGGEIRLFAAGSSANVLVLEKDDNITLRVNGKVDASSTVDMPMQLGLAYFPRLLRPDARDVFVVGFGSGTTPGASLLFRDTEVTCAEIEDAVFRASRFFHGVNHRPEESPRFTLVPDDGRSYLQGVERRFDLILSEPSNPWMAGVSNLYTREFYETAKARLYDGGVFAQWLQTYAFAPADYALVARTLLSVFDECALIRISGNDTILLTSDEPVGVEALRAGPVQAMVNAAPAVRDDLAKTFGTADVEVLLCRHLVLETEGVRALGRLDGLETVNTDLNMRLEFDAPRRLFSPPTPETDVAREILRAVSPDDLMGRIMAVSNETERPALVQFFLSRFLQVDLRDQAGRLSRLALLGMPDHPEIIMHALLWSPPQSRDEFTRLLDRLFTLAPMDVSRLVQVYLDQGRVPEATAVLEQTVQRQPGATQAWQQLAQCYAQLGRMDDARRAMERAGASPPP
jgi:spermidine synthase